MIINSGNLKTLGTGFKGNFQNGIDQAKSQFAEVATKVPSTNGREEYGWLGRVPGVREWIGDRVKQNLKNYDYAIKNRDWEQTIAVDRNDIDDDNIGIYGPLFDEMGRASAAFPDQLVFAALKAGFATTCYDGQYFFDTDHPVLDANGAVTSVANTDGGAGTPWFLIDGSRAVKPIILQMRKDFQFVARQSPEDPSVFDRKEFLYGADARMNVGYGFWQFAWGSKQTLSAANYAIARGGLMGMKGDYDRPIGVMPNTLVVPPSLEGAALKLMNNDLGANGESNEWKGTARVVVAPWLA